MAEDTPIWSVYMIRTVDDCLYSGVSTDVSRRYGEHLAGGPRAARYLRAHRPQALVFSTAIGPRSLAQKVEYQLKRLSRGQKERIIRRQRLVFHPDTGMITVWQNTCPLRPLWLVFAVLPGLVSIRFI